MSQQVFHPDPTRHLRELGVSGIAYLVAAPFALHWLLPSMSIPSLALVVLLGLLVVFVPPLVRARLRGFDLLGVGPDGLLVSRRRGGFVLPWAQISRVYRFRDTLVVETIPPIRRETIHLAGHEHHEEALFEAMKAHAETLNLSLVASLASLSSAARR